MGSRFKSPLTYWQQLVSILYTRNFRYANRTNENRLAPLLFFLTFRAFPALSSLTFRASVALSFLTFRAFPTIRKLGYLHTLDGFWWIKEICYSYNRRLRMRGAKHKLRYFRNPPRQLSEMVANPANGYSYECNENLANID